MKTTTGSDFDTEVIFAKQKYLVQTERIKDKKLLIITRIYLKGEILLTKKTDYSYLTGVADAEERVLDLMRRQHLLVTDILQAGGLRESSSISDYLEEVKGLLKVKNKRKALRVLSEALEHYPDDPFLLSYYGCLDAVANKNFKDGIDMCLTAIGHMKGKVPLGEKSFYPIFFLNLGRAYLAAGKKKEAIEAFNKGLKADSKDNELLWEIRKLGVRRKPPVPFLKRSNPINKYIGKLLHSMKE